MTERELRIDWNEHVASAANHLLMAKVKAGKLSGTGKSPRETETTKVWRSALELMDKFVGNDPVPTEPKQP